MKTYSFDRQTQTLTVFSIDGVQDFCTENGVALSEYNYYTVIDSSMISTCYLFDHCTSFNQMVVIPPSVKKCDYMFRYCSNLNSPVIIPDGVISCTGMFSFCRNFNFPVELPDSVRYCTCMFLCCNRFNQPMEIPASVKDCAAMFKLCGNLDQLVVVPDQDLAGLDSEVALDITEMRDFEADSRWSNIFEMCKKMQFNGIPVRFKGGNNGEENTYYR